MTQKSDEFEQKLARLEEIVRRLENEDVGLSDTVNLYDEGTQLVQQCGDLLKAAQTKIAAAREKMSAAQATPVPKQPPPDLDEEIPF